MQKMDMTSDPIPGLVKSMAIPASIGFFFQTMFNVVDTYWAGVLSTEAQAALAISFPVFFILIAMGSGLGTAANVLMSNAMGAKNHSDAAKYAAQSVSFGIIISVFITLLGLMASPFLFGLLGASGPYLELSLQYMNTILLGTVFFMMSFLLNSFLNTYGDTKSFRNALVVGTLMNIVLDPILMFGFWVVPPLGITGLALATVLIQFLQMAYLAMKVHKTGLLKGARNQEYAPRKETFAEITKQSLPASLNMMTVAIGIFVITYFISVFGKEAVAAYGIATRIEQVMLLPTIGLNIATMTLVGHNYGAKQFERVRQAYFTALEYGLGIMVIGVVVVFAFAEQLMKLFTSDAAVIAIAVPYLKIAAFIFWAYVILFLTISMLQGLKRPMFALWIGLFRQIVAPILVFWLFVEVMRTGISGIWWGIFAVTWTATAITLLYARSTLKKVHLIN